MQEPAKHLTVIVDVEGSTLQAEAWLKKLRSLVRRAPEGVRVVLHEADEGQFEIKEVKAFFKAQNYKQWNASAQLVFCWLIENLNHKLVVSCQECGRGFGQQKDCCRCPDKGSDSNGYWGYKFYATVSDSLIGWQIATSSLHRIGPADLQKSGIGDVNRRRILELIEHLTAQ